VLAPPAAPLRSSVRAVGPTRRWAGRAAPHAVPARALSALTPPARVVCQARREKLAHFDKECTRLVDGLYVGGDTVARSREALAAAGVTHVLNATGFASPNYFRAVAPPGSAAALAPSPSGAPGAAAAAAAADDELPRAADGGPALSYKTLWLQDTPGEDLGCVLYDSLDWLEGVRASGGVALVHCSQGVSRSVALCIGYLMWRDGAGYDDTFARVKAARGVANPNMGFACQLLQWAKRRGTPPDGARLYRISPHSAADPRFLVPRQAPRPLAAALDARTACVVHTRDAVYVWRGAACAEAAAAAAAAVAAQLAKYEGAPGPAVCVACGCEPAALLDALGVAPDARGPGGVGLLGADSLRVAAFDDALDMYAAGRRRCVRACVLPWHWLAVHLLPPSLWVRRGHLTRAHSRRRCSDCALRGGAGAQEQALAAGAAGGGPPSLLPQRGSAPQLAPRTTPRMSTPMFAPSGLPWCADPSALRRSPMTPRLSSPATGGCGGADAFPLPPPPPPEPPLEEREPAQLYAIPSLEARTVQRVARASVSLSAGCASRWHTPRLMPPCPGSALCAAAPRHSDCTCSIRTTCCPAAPSCCCPRRAPCMCGWAQHTHSSSHQGRRRRRRRRASPQPQPRAACPCPQARACRWSWRAQSRLPSGPRSS
jgi:hypothetical protein